MRGEHCWAVIIKHAETRRSRVEHLRAATGDEAAARLLADYPGHELVNVRLAPKGARATHV